MPGFVDGLRMLLGGKSKAATAPKPPAPAEPASEPAAPPAENRPGSMIEGATNAIKKRNETMMALKDGGVIDTGALHNRKVAVMKKRGC